jgi:TolB protein
MKLRICGAIFVIAALAGLPGGMAEPEPRVHGAFPGANGKIAFVRQLEVDQNWGEIFLMDADGANQTAISNNPEYDEDPAWSPDGTRIAFIRRPLQVSEVELWVMNADGSNQVSLTNTAGPFETHPSWSPQGDRIVYATDGALQVIDVSDLSVTDLGVTGHSPAWSPDGGRIAFIASFDPPGVQNVYVMNADGTNPVNIGYPGTVEGGPAWSPDGTRIAFDDSGEIYVTDECGGNRSQISDEVSGFALQPAWSPDGTKIVFWVDDTLVSVNPDGSGQQLLTTDAYFSGPDWQPVVEVPPVPVPRPHVCVSLAPAATATPSPSLVPAPSPPPPIELPFTGGAPAGSSGVLPAIMVLALLGTGGVAAGMAFGRRRTG